jgi:hypothetical protein
MHETQRSQLTDLAFVDRRLKAEIELIEVLHKRQMGQLKSRSQVTAPPRVDFTAEQIAEEVRVTWFGLRCLLQQVFQSGLNRFQAKSRERGLQMFDCRH